jgi:hypothetical protein
MTTLERDSAIAKAMRGLSPERWGSAGWKFLHFVALAYPALPTERHAREYGEFVRSLQNVLPCESCRSNMARHLRESPPDSALRAGKRAFFEWTVDLHNAVNHDLGKLPMDAARARSRLMASNGAGLLLAALAALGVAIFVGLSAHIFKTHVKG